MGPSGLWKDTQRQKAAKPFVNFEERLRVPTRRVPDADRHLFALIGMCADGLTHPISITIQLTAANGEVFLFHLALLELSRHVQMSLVVLGDDDDAASVTV